VIWLGWRQQRGETLIALGIIGLLAALLIPTGLSMSSAFDQDGIAAAAALLSLAAWWTRRRLA
jgi:hypothetical protein